MTKPFSPNSSDFSSISPVSINSGDVFSSVSNDLGACSVTERAETPIFTGVDARLLSVSKESPLWAILKTLRRHIPDINISRNHMVQVKNKPKWCMFHVAGLYAEIHQRVSTGKHKWSQVVRCKSVHQCPICSVIERRKKAVLIQHLINQHLKCGGGVAMLTVTAPFYQDDSLEFAIDGLLSSVKGFWDSRARRNATQRLGMIGSIRNLEITWGRENGWHPHSHFLLFIDDEFDCADLEYEFYPIWKNYVEKRLGRTPSKKHGVNVVRGETAAEYLSKAGFDSAPDLPKEITHAHCKLAKGDRFTPFGLLEQVELDALNRNSWIRLWMDYVCATHGRHTISRFDSLLKFYGVSKQDQEEIISRNTETVLKARVPEPLYRKIYANDLLGPVLGIFDAGGDLEDVYTLLGESSLVSYG